MPPTRPILTKDTFQLHAKHTERLNQALVKWGALALELLPNPPTTATKDTWEALAYFQQTHLDVDKVPLTVDCKVGPKTWWALDNGSGRRQDSPQRSGIRPTLPEGLEGPRKSVLETALHEHSLDVKEDPPGSNRGPRVDLYLPKWLKKEDGSGAPWCACFVSWCQKQALGVCVLGSFEASCFSAHKRAQKENLWVEGIPVPGDQFIMLYRKGKRLTGRGHTGFVLRVSEDGQLIQTVEGNVANRVAVKVRKLETVEGFISMRDENPVNFTHGLDEGVGLAGGESTR